MVEEFTLAPTLADLKLQVPAVPVLEINSKFDYFLIYGKKTVSCCIMSDY